MAASPAQAQITSGTVTGRITDEQGAAIPGVALRALGTETGFTREDVSDSEGNYRLAALPVGSYLISAAIPGFTAFERPVTVNVSTTVPLDIRLRIAQIVEQVSVVASLPLIPTRSSAVEEVVDLDRIEGLPLNGRQFANLVSTVPGVGLGFHSDVSKSAQYTPQISGGNGRNLNYVVDGGDNNDDTVGGLLQMFPLEAIREFSVATQRFNAEYGRSNGAVLNVVTKSGTNTLHGSAFTMIRDDAMNARTVSEAAASIEKQAYRRYQYGGSFGGPLKKDKAHYFGAFERTHQDTRQVVDTLGLYSAEDGVYDIRNRQNLFTGKVSAQPALAHSVAVRYGRDHNSQPNGAALRSAHSSWSTSTNSFDSVNVNHNWVVGRRALNELVVQYSRFTNEIPVSTPGPVLMFPNQVLGGANLAAPQTTEQVKWQIRNDYSWTAAGLGVAHEFRTGVNWVHEPTLSTSAGQGHDGFYTMLQNSVTGPVQRVLVIGGDTVSNIPIDLTGAYVQDDWRVTDRLTLNLGVRYDYVSGMPIDQTLSSNFQKMQAAGRAGSFAGTLLEDFGKDVRPDRNNVQPRLGAAYNLRGDGRDVVRGGWGIYTDFGYTNANALTASLDGGGIIFSASSNSGLRKPDGSFFVVGDPLDSIAALNTVDTTTPPTAGEVVSPVLQQPFTYQTNVGWSHEITPTMAVRADYVKVQGRNLNVRMRPNTLVNGTRLLGAIGVQPNDSNFRAAIDKGRSEYNALIVGLRRRMSRGIDVNAGYTLARATSDVGSAYDEIVNNLLQDVSEPFSDVQMAPSTRTDSRHAITVSGIVAAPWDISVAPILMFRSALPVHTFQGSDVNRDGNINDISRLAYRYTGLDANGRATYEEMGTCETVNCSRRAPFSQLNLRVSKAFHLAGTARLEAIAEVFNLFNAKNPSLALTQRVLSANGTPNPTFMQPSAYAGDVGQPEQRVGQVGFRFTF